MSDSMLDQLRDQLVRRIGSYGSCAVAFSGGVDSAVVAQAAFAALGQRAVAVTARSAALADGELECAERVATQIGIRHELVSTDELSQPQYVENAPDRCFHCKQQLYTHMEPVARRLGLAVLVNGANVDDVGDYRPGMQAARDHQVRSPLIECQIGKADVRRLADLWELEVADKPATPCLASRIAYGEQVTRERLEMIDQAEAWLRNRGLRLVRVRYHGGDMARLEVPLQDVARLADGWLREQLVRELKSLGFQYITLDLEGFRSGSLNEVISIETPDGRAQ